MAQVLKNILYAEDEADIRQIAVLALETLGGFTVETCESGVGIVDKARSCQPDLVILDVMMPEVDGPSAFAALRNTPEFAATPILFMTAKVQPHEVAELMKLGAADVISKPFEPVALPQQILSIWNRVQDVS